MELRRRKNVVRQQTEQYDMASDNHSERAAPERKPGKGIHPAPASPQGGPPNFSDGQESPRSSHC